MGTSVEQEPQIKVNLIAPTLGIAVSWRLSAAINAMGRRESSLSKKKRPNYVQLAPTAEMELRASLIWASRRERERRTL